MPNHFQAHDRALSHPNWSSSPKMGSSYKTAVAAATLIHTPVGREIMRGMQLQIHLLNAMLRQEEMIVIWRDLLALLWSTLLWGLLQQRASDIRGNWAWHKQRAQVWPCSLYLGWATPWADLGGGLPESPSLSKLGEDFSTRLLETLTFQLDIVPILAWGALRSFPQFLQVLWPAVLLKWPSANPPSPGSKPGTTLFPHCSKEGISRARQQCWYHHQSLVSGVIWKTFANLHVGWCGSVEEIHLEVAQALADNCTYCCLLTHFMIKQQRKAECPTNWTQIGLCQGSDLTSSESIIKPQEKAAVPLQEGKRTTRTKSGQQGVNVEAPRMRDVEVGIMQKETGFKGVKTTWETVKRVGSRKGHWTKLFLQGHGQDSWG